MINTKSLLGTALAREWVAMSVNTGISVPRLAQMMLRAIDDPQVIAVHAVECRLLADRRDAARRAR